MKNSKTALILGASGMVGSYLLNLLLNDGRYSNIKIVVRNVLHLSHPKLEQVIVDFNSLSQYNTAFVVDEVFCCLGSTIKKAGSQEAFYKVDATYPYEAAKIAAEAGVKQFQIVTAMGADKSSGLFYSRVKGEVEEKISKLPFTGVHLIRPSLLLGDRNEKRPREAIGQKVMKSLGFLMIGGLKKYKAIEAKTVAKAMVVIVNQNLTGVHVFESDKLQELGE